MVKFSAVVEIKIDNGEGWGVRIKGSVLFVLISGLGTALAMAVPATEDNSVPDVVGAVEKDLSSPVRSGVEQGDSRSEVHFDLSAIKRTVPENIQSSALFQSKSWYKAPPLPPQPAVSLQPPAPSVPTLPFTYVGRMINGNDVILFLSKNDREYTVKKNDVLEGTYRVDTITENNAVLTYLPMNTTQILAFNSTAVGGLAMSSPASATAILPFSAANNLIDLSR